MEPLCNHNEYDPKCPMCVESRVMPVTTPSCDHVFTVDIHQIPYQCLLCGIYYCATVPKPTIGSINFDPLNQGETR